MTWQSEDQPGIGIGSGDDARPHQPIKHPGHSQESPGNNPVEQERHQHNGYDVAKGK